MTRSARDTPMMRQYLGIKAQHPDDIVFYRMGDFYELFLDDAELAAPLLEITLTSRDKGKPDPVPMCGVPVHSADAYVRRLAELGHRVAICEQVEDPKSTAGRGLVRRQVVEVVTPGLVGDPAGIDGRSEVAVVALARSGDAVGLAVLDASTGSFRATGSPSREAGLPQSLQDELARIAPREVLLDEAAGAGFGAAVASCVPGAVRTNVAAESFDPAACPVRPEGFDPDAAAPEQRAAAALLSYLDRHQPAAVRQPPALRSYALGDAMVLDAATRAHLELFESSEDRSRRGTLIERIDQTRTPLGARRLARWVAYPLCDAARVRRRQDAVAWLAERDRPRSRLREALAVVRDLERIFSKCQRPAAEPRDLAALRGALEALPGVVQALAAPEEDALLASESRPPALAVPAPIPEAEQLLREALVDEPRPLPRGSRGANETGFIRGGCRPELDVLRGSARKGREGMASTRCTATPSRSRRRTWHGSRTTTSASRPSPTPSASPPRSCGRWSPRCWAPMIVPPPWSGRSSRACARRCSSTPRAFARRRRRWRTWTRSSPWPR
jgi:DNA mismatch repair protein MutS